LKPPQIIRQRERPKEKEKSAAKHIPIIATTAHALGDRRLAAGMDDYVSKPINANDLFAAFGRVMPASQAHA
jgi:two-component system sensor histidine kinase/response regulator